MTELTVHRSGAGASVTFELAGGPAEALMIVMVEEGVEQPTWWLASDAFNAVLPYTVDDEEPESLSSADEGVIANALLARGADPASLEAARGANRPLRSFTYGIVPPGFRQVIPAGAPAPLEPGKRYSVSIVS